MLRRAEQNRIMSRRPRPVLAYSEDILSCGGKLGPAVSSTVGAYCHIGGSLGAV